MILYILYTANWSKINSRKQELIDKSNEKENNKIFNYDYTVGDKVSINYDDICQKLTHHRQGPFCIIQVYSNGMVKIQHGCL
jgi:hypothetical protein